MHSQWRAASWRRRASRPLSLPARSRCCSSPTAQHPPDRRLAHAVHLHELATCRPVGEQAPCLGLLLVAEGSALRLGGEVEPCATERVADCVAAQVVLLGKLVRGRPGLVVLDQELDDRPVEGVLLGDRAVVDLSCRLACRGQELGQFRGFPGLLAVVSQEPDKKPWWEATFTRASSFLRVVTAWSTRSSCSVRPPRKWTNLVRRCCPRSAPKGARRVGQNPRRAMLRPHLERSELGSECRASDFVAGRLIEF